MRIEAAAGHVLDSYLHVQGGRGVNAVLVELAGGNPQLAHDIAVHVAFARPRYLSRDEVPADEVEKERATLEAITRNEGKPEQALPKIVEGRLNGFFKESASSSSPTPRTTSSRSASSSAGRRSSASPRSRSAESPGGQRLGRRTADLAVQVAAGGAQALR